MSTVYNPHDIDYLVRRQRERDEHALGLTDQAGNTPLELAAGSRREMLMDELDAGKNRRAPEPLPDRLAANQASNNARRRVAPIWNGPTTQEPLLGANRGAVTDMSTPMDPSTADSLVRLLRQAGRHQAAKAVIDQVQRGGRPW
jgi:hypothetical protein